MKIALIASNVVKIANTTKKGSEIFDYILATNLKKVARKQGVNLTVFASGNSKTPTKIQSVNFYSSTEDRHIGMENHKIFELALVAKAVSMQKKFDLLHLSIGNGELILPFLPYLKRPVLITMHGSLYEKSVQKYMTIFPKMSSNPPVPPPLKKSAPCEKPSKPRPGPAP